MGETYPTPEERTRIIARRKQLERALVEYLVTRSPVEAEARAQLNPLVRAYGFAEVHRMLARISQRLTQSADARQAEIALYAEYVHLYQRFGGARPFLDPMAFRRLNTERARLIGRELLEGQRLTQGEQQRLRELNDLLLAEAYLWDDLVPEQPPVALAQTSTRGTSPRKLGRNEPCWCGSGRKYKHCHGK